MRRSERAEARAAVALQREARPEPWPAYWKSGGRSGDSSLAGSARSRLASVKPTVVPAGQTRPSIRPSGSPHAERRKNSHPMTCWVRSPPIQSKAVGARVRQPPAQENQQSPASAAASSGSRRRTPFIRVRAAAGCAAARPPCGGRRAPGRPSSRPGRPSQSGSLPHARLPSLQQHEHLHVEQPALLAQPRQEGPQERRAEELHPALRVVEAEAEEPLDQGREDAACCRWRGGPPDGAAGHEHARAGEDVQLPFHPRQHADEPPRLARADRAIGIEEAQPSALRGRLLRIRAGWRHPCRGSSARPRSGPGAVRARRRPPRSSPPPPARARTRRPRCRHPPPAAPRPGHGPWWTPRRAPPAAPEAGGSRDTQG